MLMRMLMALRIQRWRGERRKVRARHCKVGYLEARIVRRYSGGNQRSEALWIVRRRHSRAGDFTYRIVLAHVVSLVKQGLLVLHIAMRVTVHFSTIGRRRHSMVVLVDLVLRLRKYRSSCLTKLHAVVERELVALLPASILRGVAVERCRTVGGRALCAVFAAVVIELSEIDIQAVEVYEIIHPTKRLVCRAVHGTKRRLCGGPRLAVHVGDADRGGKRGSAACWSRRLLNSVSGGG
jgi:hypothetical protein